MRRIDLRRNDGVAMTEFALILPVFVLIIVGILSFGRVFFYWIEANHLANETARWAVVDKNPYAPATLQQAARDSSSKEFQQDVKVCIDFPTGRSRRRPGARPRAEAVLARPDPERRDDHDQGVVGDAHRAASAARTERRPPTTRPGTSRREPAHEPPTRERTRGERGQVVVLAALMIPVFLLLGALVVDAGNWYAHKRSLQNRADAGALAAGLEYIKNNNLRNCVLGARHDGHDDLERRQGVRRHERYVGRHDLQQERQQSVERHGRGERDEPDRARLDGRRQPVRRPLRRRAGARAGSGPTSRSARGTSGRSSARSASACRRSRRRRASRSSRSSASARTACRSSPRPATRSSASGRSSCARGTARRRPGSP